MKTENFDADAYADFLISEARKDMDLAERLIGRKRMGFALFIAHACLQKEIAAIICKQTHKMPPWRSDVRALARIAKIRLTKKQRDFCKVMNFYHKEGNYLGLEYPEPSKKAAFELLSQAREMTLSLSNSFTR
jgi:HEPN domain-containing protein